MASGWRAAGLMLTAYGTNGPFGQGVPALHAPSAGHGYELPAKKLRYDKENATMTNRNPKTQATKALACTAAAATTLMLMLGMVCPASAAGIPQEIDGSEPVATVVSDLSAIEDGYDAGANDMAYIIDIGA